MITTQSSRRGRVAAVATILAATVLAFGPMGNAGADPVSAGTASAYGVTANLGGQEVIPPTPAQEASVVGESDAEETLVEVPADPLVVSGTFTASAKAHDASDIASVLQVNQQEVDGPYNTQGFTLVEGLDVAPNSVEEEVSLVTAEVIRSEAVGVCTGGAVQYSANSEIVNLEIGGTDVPLNGPLEEVLAGIDTVLTETTLDQVIDIEYNRVTESADGIAVDALVITVLAAAGEDPAGEIVIGHAETGGLVCGAAAQAPECSDGADNDGDGKIDHPDDPGCDSPEDDSEVDAPQCSDGIDNDGDGKIDHPNDPGCDSPQDDDETDQLVAVPDDVLPRTGGESTTALVIGAAMALAAFGLHRFRSVALD